MVRVIYLIILLLFSKNLTAEVVVSKGNGFKIDDEQNYEESNKILKQITDREREIFLKQNADNIQQNQAQNTNINSTNEQQTVIFDARNNTNQKNSLNQNLQTQNNQDNRSENKKIDLKNDKQFPTGNLFFLKKNDQNNIENPNKVEKEIQVVSGSKNEDSKIETKDTSQLAQQMQQNKKKSINDFDPFSVYENKDNLVNNRKEVIETSIEKNIKTSEADDSRANNNFNQNFNKVEFKNNLPSANINLEEKIEDTQAKQEKTVKVGPKTYYEDNKMINLILDKLSNTVDKNQRESLLKRLNYYINKKKSNDVKTEISTYNDNSTYINNGRNFASSSNAIKLEKMPIFDKIIIENQKRREKVLDRIWNKEALNFSIKEKQNKKNQNAIAHQDDKVFFNKSSFLEEKSAFAENKNFENIYKNNFKKDKPLNGNIQTENDQSIVARIRDRMNKSHHNNFKNNNPETNQLIAYNDTDSSAENNLIVKRQSEAKEIDAPLPDIVKRNNINNRVLPPNVSQKIYNKANRHLNPVMFYSDYRDKVFNAENFINKDNHPLIFTFIETLGDNVNLADDENNTILMYAVSYREDDLVKQLIQRGADANIKNTSGYSPLMIAAINGDYKILYNILTSKVDVNETDATGNTALMYAASSSNEDCIKILISKGANINAQNKEGFMAVHIAYKKYQETKDIQYKINTELLIDLSGISRSQFEKAGFILN